MGAAALAVLPIGLSLRAEDATAVVSAIDGDLLPLDGTSFDPAQFPELAEYMTEHIKIKTWSYAGLEHNYRGGSNLANRWECEYPEIEKDGNLYKLPIAPEKRWEPVGLTEDGKTLLRRFKGYAKAVPTDDGDGHWKNGLVGWRVDIPEYMAAA